MRHVLLLLVFVACDLCDNVEQLPGTSTTVFQPSYYPSDPRNVTLDTNRVVNGQNAARTQFPYQVSIQKLGRFSWQHFCGGSIISHIWILTAAHCTSITHSSELRRYRVAAGIILLSGDPFEQSHFVDGVINHPLFPGGTRTSPYDISLLRLATPLIYGENIQPIAIPVQGRTHRGYAMFSGWGITHTGGDTPNHLKFVDVPIIPEEECSRSLDTYLGPQKNPFSVELNVCSGTRRGGESICDGDSGGPLVLNGVLIGIISWVCVPCGRLGSPSVFTKVSALSNWIQQQIT